MHVNSFIQGLLAAYACGASGAAPAAVREPGR
jgi:hypothetical protein